MELVQLNEEEAAVFRSDMGITEAALNRVIKLSYHLLGMISFFTVGPDEVKAWTIRNNTPAVQAAGKIHSDIERGFIRAEIINYDDLVKCGSIAEGKKQALLRSEGKTHIVKDGEVINFFFNV
jgi:ribosome-binding ATPase YchF (GTP1/OBG family)